jgi:hypothetical protein
VAFTGRSVTKAHEAYRSTFREVKVFAIVFMAGGGEGTVTDYQCE